ncbi:hypothetical protein LTR66_017007 [Elasticomyces elasticus]|nr:hypothetical protein LTR66_017007 [Elasticomyces elasticus]
MAPWPNIQPRWPTSPPELQTKLQMNPTLIVSWFCTIFALVVISIRIFGRWVRTEMLFREDKVMLWAIIPLLIRMGLVHVILIWGTNNTTTTALTQADIYHRSIGSRCVLASRIFYAIYIWLAKLTILEFIQKTISQTWTKLYRIGANIMYGFLAMTLVAVIIATLSECQPFHEYWQVVSLAKPSCRIGAAQLLTMGIGDVVTDVVLIVFPIPLVIMSRTSIIKKMSLCFLFLLSIIPLAITAYRMTGTIHRHYDQQYRSLLASLEILAATCVANIIVIGSFLRDKGAKKVKYRAGSAVSGDMDGGTLSRPATNTIKRSVTMQHWGSDEDLVRDLSMAVNPSLRHASVAADLIRPAQPLEAVSSTHVQEVKPAINPYGPGLIDSAWTFRQGSATAQNGKRKKVSVASSMSSMSDLEDDVQHAPYHDEPSPTEQRTESPRYKRMDFFDIGGLMSDEAGPSEQSSISYARRASQQYSSMPVSRSGTNFLSDIGGLLGPTSNGIGNCKGRRSNNIDEEDNDLLEMDDMPSSHKRTISAQYEPAPHVRRDTS